MPNHKTSLLKIGTGLTAGLSFAMLWVLACGASERDLDQAVEQIREGRATEAIAILQEIVEKEPEGALGDRAALILGNLLVENRRPADAIEPLQRALNNPAGAPYARLLLARAAVRGQLSEHYGAATNHAVSLHGSTAGDISPLLKQEATLLLAKLYSLQGDWEKAAGVGAMLLESEGGRSLRDEARWVTAKARRQAGNTAEAHALYGTIWYETPASPWAIESRQAMRDLERSDRIRPRRLGASDHYDFIKALRRHGLHKEALTEIDAIQRRSPEYKTAGARFMKTMSQHATRSDNDCVSTARDLRRNHLSSEWVPAASIYAIKCLRRSDNTPQIRSWAHWILDNYPGHDKYFEALYNLGVYLGNVESKEEGISVLERLVREGPRHRLAPDALWKIAWFERNLERTDKATSALERLLGEHPDSGYRKAAMYWLARLQSDPRSARAIDLYQSCVAEFPNDYYGHMALEQLYKFDIEPRQVGNNRPFPEIDRLDDPAKRTGAPAAYRRAVEMKTLGLYAFAAAELQSMPETKDDPKLQFALAELYSRSGNTWEAAAIVNRYFKDFVTAGSRDPQLVPSEFWHIVYPFNHRAEIEGALEAHKLLGTGIDPYLTAALIRLESRFLPTAISPVGAVGLMQLMPKVADQIASERGLGRLSRSDLFDPKTNIDLGAYHLADLLREFDNSWFEAICAYNAGAGPVKRWAARRPALQPQDEFIENIPYVDTRLYLKIVLANQLNYEWIYPEKG